MERKFFHQKSDLILLAAVAALALGLLAWTRLSASRRDDPVAVITWDSRELMQVPLKGAEDRTISLESEGLPVSFQIQGERIRFVDVACPDHICENTGFIALPGEMAVCMPNRVVLSIRAAGE